MDDISLNNLILEFINQYPDVIDIIGYGSGVKKQNNYVQDNKQIDIIASVDNDLLWHRLNKEIHPNDYSLLSKISNIPHIHYGTDINFLTFLKHNEHLFKIGIINKNDLIEDLTTWKNFYLAGRLQKSILEVKIDKNLENAIKLNRLNALKIALILNYGHEFSEYELLYTICNLSFKNDIRMYYKMENPNKVKNILEGSYHELKEIYNSINDDIYIIKENRIIVNEDILNNLNELPLKLFEYINNNIIIEELDINKLEQLKTLITNYLAKINLKASTIQPLKSISLNPINKSITYAYQKRNKYKVFNT